MDIIDQGWTQGEPGAKEKNGKIFLGHPSPKKKKENFFFICYIFFFISRVALPDSKNSDLLLFN